MPERIERERLTITLRNDLLKRIDEFIDGYRIRNRSHAIEYLLKTTLPATVQKAFILAGGPGIKMRPFTYELPKAMIPINGRPILESTINLLRDHGIKEIIILVGILGDKIRNYFADGSKFGVRISYFEEDKPSGTARPIAKARALFEPNPFLVIYGDVLAEININDLISYHEQTNAVATMAVTSVDQSGDWGVVNFQGQKVVTFIEKPHRMNVSHNINAGIFVMNPTIFNYIPEKSFSMLEKDVFPVLAKKGLLYGYNFSGQWFDISTPEIYEQALKLWKK